MSKSLENRLLTKIMLILMDYIVCELRVNPPLEHDTINVLIRWAASSVEIHDRGCAKVSRLFRCLCQKYFSLNLKERQIPYK